MSTSSAIPDPLYTLNDWTLLPSLESSNPEKGNHYYLVWVGEHMLSPRFIAAAESLNREENKVIFAGFHVTFHLEPTPGFVVKTRPNWEIQSETQARTALEQIIWEINRQIN